MRVLPTFPPNIAELRKHFPIRPGVVFAYAPYIHNPYHATIDDALMIHEQVHIAQQGRGLLGPSEWWDLYISRPQFRLEMEYEAHLAEYTHRVALAINRNQRRAVLKTMGKKLASPLYGKMLNTRDAMTVLKRGYLHEQVQGDTSAMHSVRVE